MSEPGSEHTADCNIDTLILSRFMGLHMGHIWTISKKIGNAINYIYFSNFFKKIVVFDSCPSECISESSRNLSGFEWVLCRFFSIFNCFLSFLSFLRVSGGFNECFFAFIEGCFVKVSSNGK
jgi:hypothetical protein